MLAKCSDCGKRHVGECPPSPPDTPWRRWRQRNPDTYRQRQRELMRKRRTRIQGHQQYTQDRPAKTTPKQRP